MTSWRGERFRGPHREEQPGDGLFPRYIDSVRERTTAWDNPVLLPRTSSNAKSGRPRERLVPSSRSFRSLRQQLMWS